MSLSLTLNRFTRSSNVFIVNIEQVNVCWHDNNNDDNDHNRHNENVDRAEFTINLILFF